MHKFVKEARDKMTKCLKAFEDEIVHIRTGRASTGLVDSLEIEAYGQRMKLNQMATTSAPEARSITIQPWDKGMIGPIEKAILAANLGVTPKNDGKVIRVTIPEMSEERRRDFVKHIGKLAEEARVAVRNVRRHELEEVKKQQKAGAVPEDESRRISDEIQKATDEFVNKIDGGLKAKEKEIMEV
jgi:ribosome recycling factor